MAKFNDQIDKETQEQVEKLEVFTKGKENLAIEEVKSRMSEAFNENGGPILEVIESIFRDEAKGYIKFLKGVIRDHETSDSYERFKNKLGWDLRKFHNTKISDSLRYAKNKAFDEKVTYLDRYQWDDYRGAVDLFEIDEEKVVSDALIHYENTRDMFIYKNVYKLARVLGDRTDLDKLDVEIKYSRQAIEGHVSIELRDGTSFDIKIQVIYAWRTEPRRTFYTQYRATFHNIRVAGKDISGNSLLDVGIAMGSIDPKTKLAAIDRVESGFKLAKAELKETRKTFSDEHEWWKRWLDMTQDRKEVYYGWMRNPPKSLENVSHGDYQWIKKQSDKTLKDLKARSSNISKAFKRLFSVFDAGGRFEEWLSIGTILPLNPPVTWYSSNPEIHQNRYLEALQYDYGWHVTNIDGRWVPGASRFLLFRSDNLSGPFRIVSFKKREDAKTAVVKYGLGREFSSGVYIWGRDAEHANSKAENRKFDRIDNVPISERDKISSIQKLQSESGPLFFWFLTLIEDLYVEEGEKIEMRRVKAAEKEWWEETDDFGGLRSRLKATKQPNILRLVESMKLCGLLDNLYQYTPLASELKRYAGALKKTSSYIS